jgi:hypothetical protein
VAHRLEKKKEAPNLAPASNRVWCKVLVREYEHLEKPYTKGSWVIAKKMKIIEELGPHMTLDDIDAILGRLTIEEIITMCGFNSNDSFELVEALADHIEENQDAIQENLNNYGVV